MNFLRLHDNLLSVLFDDNDILAIDKPYGFNAHTNDSKVDHADFIRDGLIEIYEKHLNRKLHVVHRLDQTTTGVMIFGKSIESTKKYADFFFNRQVQKTYFFLTKHVSSDSQFYVDKQIVHKGRDLEAQTELSLIKKTNQFELWKALPHTGRNHQIRIHAQSVGIPILGDEKYEGKPFPFLCLHNHRIEFPNGIVITSQPPVYFENTKILQDQVLTKALFEADRRRRLFSAASKIESYRLAHVTTNTRELEFAIDQYGPNLVLNWYKDFWGEKETKTFSSFSKLMNQPLVVRNLGSAEKQAALSSSSVILPSESAKMTVNSAWIAAEGQIRYEIQTDQNSFVGGPLNQRLQRQWLFENAKDKTVLNLFSHTSGFNLAAVLGEASHVVSVETSKSALNWSRKNFILNGVDVEKHLFLCRDSLTFLSQCQTKKTKYDLIVCGAPSYLKREKKSFKIKTDLEDLLKSCLDCLKPNGDLLFSTTFDGFYIDDIRKIIIQAQRSLKIQNLEINLILPSLDFELPEEKTSLKSFLIRRK